MSLDINLFLESDDIESMQYRFLHEFQYRQRLIRQNKLYPSVRDIVVFAEELEALVKNIELLKQKFPRRIVGIDLKNQKLKYEQLNESVHLGVVYDLINWALPMVRDAANESVAAFEFVGESLKLEIVGIQPVYREEGYWFVEDPLENTIHLYKYKIGVFTQKNERFRSLKISPISVYRWQELHRPLTDIKLDLIKENPELPNPSTYITETDLDFPYEETILPVAKRKFIGHLAA